MVRARIRGLAAGVVAALVVGSGLVAAAVPARASERTVTVDPAEGLGNEVVRVSWTGFNPTEEDGRFGVLVQQCRLAPTSLADCFLGQPYPAVEEGTRQVARTGPEGSGSALFEVRPAANLPVLACSAASPCSILVYENDGVPFADDELPASAVVVEVRFAAAQADCPAVTDFDVRADGEASGTGPFYRWAADLCAGDDPLVLDYTETSSNSGRENFLSGLVDVGLTSLPATDEELEAHPEHPDFAYAPLGLTALVAVVNMRDPFTGERIEKMVLSPRLVARLITNTDIAAILADGELRTLNPGIRFPSIAIARPLLRAERNADTRLVTEWIAGSEAAQRFLAGDDEYGVRVNSAYSEYSYPRDVFENVAQDPEFVPRTGQRTVALRVFYGVKPNGASPDNTEEIGFIGLVDLPTARRFGLPVARVVNPAGEPVAPTDEAIQAGFRAMERTPEGTLAADPNAADPAAYPLVKVDYAMVPTAPEGELRRDLSRFLRYAVDEGQESLPPGHLPLPESLRKETRRLADAMDRASATTTTTTPTTVPVDDPVPVVAPAPPVSGSGYTTVGSGGAVDPVAAPTSAPAVGERVVTTKVVLASASGGRLLPALLVVGVLAVIGFVVTSGVPVRVRRRLRGPSA